MAGRTWTILLRYGIALLLLFAAFAAGCGGSPRERYQVLSYFFDGVPNPDAPKNNRNPDTTGGTKVITASIVSQHKPFVDAGSDPAKCAVCHRNSEGEIQEFSEAYKACVKCHTKISTSLPKMHGPVAREACKFCHAPHESTQPHLLKDEPINVCTQCHDQTLLGDKPPQHLDGQTSCLDCHFGHGGNERYFIKPSPTSVQPAPPPTTAPATLPATQAAVPPDTPSEPAAAVASENPTGGGGSSP